jgi:hypothetical protein
MMAAEDAAAANNEETTTTPSMTITARNKRATKATTTQKKKKRSDDGESKRKPQAKQRTPNFQVADDVALCKAFVNCTLNPLVGNDQRAEIFWDTVLEAYNNIIAKDATEDDVFVVERESASIRNRFQRSIAKQVKEWNPFYKRVAEAPPSGTTKNDWIRLASEEYQAQYGRRFLFEHCIEILQDLPKFDPMVRDASGGEYDFIEENGDPASVNNTRMKRRKKRKRVCQPKSWQTKFLRKSTLTCMILKHQARVLVSIPTLILVM